MAKVKTPVAGFNGLVAGVTFVDGEATTTNKAALAYFARQGYEISGRAASSKQTKGDDKADPKGDDKAASKAVEDAAQK